MILYINNLKFLNYPAVAWLVCEAVCAFCCPEEGAPFVLVAGVGVLICNNSTSNLRVALAGIVCIVKETYCCILKYLYT